MLRPLTLYPLICLSLLGACSKTDSSSIPASTPHGDHMATGTATSTTPATSGTTAVSTVNDVKKPKAPTTPTAPSTSPSPTNPAPTTPTTAPAAPLPALVAQYGRWQGALEKYDHLLYRPRQFAVGLGLDLVSDYGNQVVQNPGIYAGWDVLSLPNLYHMTLQSEAEGVHLSLNRPARIGLVWRAGSWQPGWLAGWTKGGTVQVKRGDETLTYPVYTREFPAGLVNLPSVGIPGEAGTQNYTVLVGEQGGAATPAPSVPGGQEAPVANATCPAWVHDQYVALGPDGKNYPTWHPQIDPVYWCYFRHEHGSDPRLAGVDASGKALYTPLFGYTAGRHGMNEPHAGFKSIAFRNTDNTWWNLTVHMGSAGIGRVCMRYHTVDLGITDGKTLKADLHLMGDFGRAKYFEATSVEKEVTGCPVDQFSIRDMGSRTLGGPNTDGYEPWTMDNEYNITGFAPRFLSVKQSFPMTRCASVPDCSSLEDLTKLDPIHTGSERLLEVVDTFVKAGNHGQNVGVYYTDPMGEKFLAASDPMSTRQFIATGFSSTLSKPTNPTGYCTARDAWREEFKCQETQFLTGDKSIENSLRAPN